LPNLKKNVIITSDLNLFHISGIFPRCFVCFLPANKGVRRKFPRGVKVSSQSCDVTIQF